MTFSHPRPPLPEEDLEHVLSYTRDLWQEARGCRFLITGGTGFFGMWLLESFVHINKVLNLGMHAVVLTRDPESFAKKAPHMAGLKDLEFFRGDIRRFAYPEGEFHYVLHAATEASARLNAENPREMFGSIVAGTEHVLGFAAEKGVRKFLLTSSGAVYGKQPSEITHVPETYMGAPDPLQPGSAYGIGKRAAEHLCVLASAAKGFEVKIARCFAFVGPHLPLDTHFAIGNFIRDALLGQPMVVQGDGTPYRSYLYASDLAVALWTILFRGMSARAYNVGSGRDLSILQLAGAVCSAMGLPESVRTLTKPLDATRPSRYVPDVNRAEQELGLREIVNLADAVRKTGDWYRAGV